MSNRSDVHIILGYMGLFSNEIISSLGSDRSSLILVLTIMFFVVSFIEDFFIKESK